MRHGWGDLAVRRDDSKLIITKIRREEREEEREVRNGRHWPQRPAGWPRLLIYRPKDPKMVHVRPPAILPSLLACDLANLANEANRVAPLETDYVSYIGFFSEYF